jgi:predicted alpha/beta-fold hydrolase
MPIKESKFVPALGLSNPHVQTMLPSLMPENHLLRPVRRERLTMPDGDFFDFDWFTEKSTGPIVIILHGMTGSLNSHYVQSILRTIKKKGWRPIFMYYRGCSGEPNLLDKSYHVGDTLGFNTLVSELKKRDPDAIIAAVGYSLGANILLKWLGETKNAAKLLTTAVAVSVPFDLKATANRLREGFSRFYQWWLIGDLHDYVRRKFQQKEPPFDFGDVTHLKSFWEFDNAITAPLNGFINASDYYDKNSCRQFLSLIKTPTLILHSKDDPFLTLASIPSEEELSPDIILELSETGGHVGFVTGNPFIWELDFWLEKRIPEHLEHYLKIVDIISGSAKPKVKKEAVKHLPPIVTA